MSALFKGPLCLRTLSQYVFTQRPMHVCRGSFSCAEPALDFACCSNMNNENVRMRAQQTNHSEPAQQGGEFLLLTAPLILKSEVSSICSACCACALPHPHARRLRILTTPTTLSIHRQADNARWIVQIMRRGRLSARALASITKGVAAQRKRRNERTSGTHLAFC